MKGDTKKEEGKGEPSIGALILEWHNRFNELRKQKAHYNSIQAIKHAIRMGRFDQAKEMYREELLGIALNEPPDS